MKTEISCFIEKNYFINDFIAIYNQLLPYKKSVTEKRT